MGPDQDAQVFLVLMGPEGHFGSLFGASWTTFGMTRRALDNQAFCLELPRGQFRCPKERLDGTFDPIFLVLGPSWATFQVFLLI